MMLSALIEGLAILRAHYGRDGYHCSSEHDQIYMEPTDQPLSPAMVDRMRELGWFQPNDDYSEEDPENLAEIYYPSEGWSCFT